MNFKRLLALPVAAASAVVLASCSAPSSQTTVPGADSPTMAPQQLVPATNAAHISKPAPDFTMTDTNGKLQTLSSRKGKYVVLEWSNPDCPFVHKHYDSGNMQKVQKAAIAGGAVWFTVMSSAPGKEGYYSSKKYNELAKKNKAHPTAILTDPTGQIGKLYGAKTTPHMFVISPKGILLYDGAIDDKPSTDAASLKGAKNYVLIALAQAKAGKKVTTSSTQPYGCSVKY